MQMWLTHPRSKKPDAMLTLAVLSTLVVLVRFLAANITLSFSGINLVFGPLESGLVASILTPTLGAYVARKWKDSPDVDKG